MIHPTNKAESPGHKGLVQENNRRLKHTTKVLDQYLDTVEDLRDYHLIK